MRIAIQNIEEFMYCLIDAARCKLKSKNIEIKGKVYAINSTTIDLCLNVFGCAKFCKAKGGM